MKTTGSPELDYSPKQQRSRETLHRLLVATRELLAESAFEELSIKQIVTHAGCSVGNFYERFPNKEALVPHLLAIHYQELEEQIENLVAMKDDADLSERARMVVRLLLDVARKQKGLIRTLVLRNSQRPDSIPAEIRSSARRILSRLYRFILLDPEEIGHPNPARAVEVGLLMVTAAVRERVVLQGTTHAATLTVSDRRLEDELVIALVAYLGATQIKSEGQRS